MDAVLQGPNGSTPLGPAGVMLGRTPENQIVVNDNKASSQHAQIRPAGQGYTIADLGSTNGTYINGQKLELNAPRMLMPGDTIRIGDTSYIYQEQNSPQAGGYASQGTPPPNYQPTQVAPSPQPPFQSTSYGGPAGYQPGQPASSYQPTLPVYPPYEQQYNQPQGLMPPPPPPGQAGPSYYDQNSAPTQQASYLAGGVGTPSSPYNAPYTPGISSGTPPYNPAPAGYPVQGGGYLPPGQPQGSGKPKRNPLLTIILVAVALLVIIGAVSTFFVVHNNQIATNNNSTATAAAQGNTNATQTAFVQATGAAIANATASASAQNADPYSSTGTLAFEDALKDNSGGHGWQADSNCRFTQGVYEITESQSNTFYSCDATSTNYSNMAFDVALKIIQGDCAGIAFRANPSNDAEYFFEMCQSGTYDLVKYDGTNSKYLIDVTSSSAIKTGVGQINTLGVVANGSSIQLYINETSVDHTTDSTYSSGSIGLVAVNHASSSTLVAFAGVRVWTL